MSSSEFHWTLHEGVVKLVIKCKAATASRTWFGNTAHIYAHTGEQFWWHFHVFFDNYFHLSYEAL